MKRTNISGLNFTFPFKLCNATDPNRRRSITDTTVYWNDPSTAFSSVMQKYVALSISEAELVTVVIMRQDMVYVYRVIKG